MFTEADFSNDPPMTRPLSRRRTFVVSVGNLEPRPTMKGTKREKEKTRNKSIKEKKIEKMFLYIQTDRQKRQSIRKRSLLTVTTATTALAGESLHPTVSISLFLIERRAILWRVWRVTLSRCRHYRNICFYIFETYVCSNVAGLTQGRVEHNNRIRQNEKEIGCQEKEENNKMRRACTRRRQNRPKEEKKKSQRKIEKKIDWIVHAPIVLSAWSLFSYRLQKVKKIRRSRSDR